MLRLTPPRLALCSLLASTACDRSTDAATKAHDAAKGLGGAAAVVGSLAPAGPAANTCSGPAGSAKRYVAIVDGEAACTALPDWSATPLFRQANTAELWNSLGLTMPDPLARFCVYAWTGAGIPASGPTVGSCTRLDPDPDIVVPQAPSALARDPVVALRSTQSKQLRQALGAVPAGDSPPPSWPYDGDAFGLPYVAVVDTADSSPPGAAMPSLATAPPRQRHGLAMRALVDAVRCPWSRPACLRRQLNTQALPYDAAHHQPLPSGGQRGSLGSLASAIGEAVLLHQSTPDVATSPLVINLSVGWDSTDVHLAGDPTGLLAKASATVPAPAQAVYAAIAWASCRGGVSLAASGNNRGSLCEQRGPVAPAAWERWDAPGAACGAFGLASTPSGPLVYAVGGVDHGDRPIDNARLESMPRRALYAHQAVVTPDSGSAWTGTSISTAALSAIVAGVWSHRRNDLADGVMALVDGRGTTLSTPAALLPRHLTSAPALRLDAHDVFEHPSLTSLPGHQNPYMPRPSAPSSSEISSTIDRVLGAQHYALGQPAPAPLVSHVDSDACAPTPVQVHALPGATAPPPPIDHLSDETRPQPHVPICPMCVVRKKSTTSSSGSSTPSSGSFTIGTLATATTDYDLYLELDPAYLEPNVTVSHPALTFHDPAGSYVSVALGTMSLGTAQLLELGAYTLGSSGPAPQTLAAWLDSHPAVVSGRVTLRVDDGSGSGPQTIGHVIDVVR